MSKYAIQVEGLGKEYVIGGAEQRYESFRNVLSSVWYAPFKKFRKLSGVVGEDERFWALRNVSFAVEQGEVLGVIGRNGAGKSTLLKVLSRITSPTEGRVVTTGRIASLLEVGTGFHGELTGRENIFLNGAILGMKRREIEERFQSIVDFSGIEKFINTPVKRYSSGMYVRLAFAVAAELSAEVLLVDEVLAVGDQAFQEKCLGRMSELGSVGRTAVFISHNLSMIRKLCDRVLLLDHGLVSGIGSPDSIIELYNSEIAENEGIAGAKGEGVIFSLPLGDRNENFVLSSIRICDISGQPKKSIHTWDSFVLVMQFRCSEAVDRAACGLIVETLDGVKVMDCSSFRDNDLIFSLAEGTSEIGIRFDQFPLSAGKFLLGAGIALRGEKWLCFNRIHFEVQESDVYSSGFPPKAEFKLVAPDFNWIIGEGKS